MRQFFECGHEALRCDSGAVAIEYSMIAGMIAFVIIAAVTSVGADLLAILQGLADSL